MQIPDSGAVACPTCGSDGPVALGTCRFADWAESQSVAELRASAGGLYRCPACSLVYRWPVPSEQQLAEAYASIPTDAWSYVRPPYWEWTLDVLQRHAPNRNILDVGCFRGDFLNTLPPGWQRFGIEPNTAAANIARTKDITMLGERANDRIEPPHGGFGAIVMLDVIEHVVDPAATVAHLSGYLAAGGLIIIVTGNADHWLPRWSLPHYWYMSFPYHLCYLSRGYFSYLCEKQSLRMLEWRSFPHHKYGPRRRMREYVDGLMQVGRRILSHESLAGLSRHWPLSRMRLDGSSPMLFGVADHCWTVLRKSNS